MGMKDCFLNLGQRCLQARSNSKCEYNITRFAYRFYLCRSSSESFGTTIQQHPYWQF
jgi:hypothetical protein